MMSKDLTISAVTAQVCSEEGAVRLVGGPTETEGRVEICVNRRWGSACGSNWDNREASVTCKQLGYDCKVLYLSIANVYCRCYSSSIVW